VTRVQVNNTPCWQPAWGSTRAREWATTLADVLDALRPEIGPGVQLGRTPRATPTTLESWQAAARAKLLPRCDWIAAPSYWQAARDRWNPAFGAASEVYGTWGKPVILTEWGSSLCQTGAGGGGHGRRVPRLSSTLYISNSIADGKSKPLKRRTRN
jgi:hypothetical protein